MGREAVIMPELVAALQAAQASAGTTGTAGTLRTAEIAEMLDWSSKRVRKELARMIVAGRVEAVKVPIRDMAGRHTTTYAYRLVADDQPPNPKRVKT